MAWCHQATSHYLSKCWTRSRSPCGVTRPQWVVMSGNWYSWFPTMYNIHWNVFLRVPLTNISWGNGLLPYVNVDFGSDNGSLPGSTKPLPELMVTYHPWSLVALTWGQIKILDMRMRKSWKITAIYIYPQRANEINSVTATYSRQADIVLYKYFLFYSKYS